MKYFLKSKTIQGIALALAGTIAGAANQYGFAWSESDVARLIELSAQVIGLAWGLYGRKVATEPLTFKKIKD